jgi:hypothetical protein
MTLRSLIRVVGVLFLAGVAAENLGAQGPGYGRCQGLEYFAWEFLVYAWI